jgi:hypothetical protein
MTLTFLSWFLFMVLLLDDNDHPFTTLLAFLVYVLALSN